MGCRHCHAEVDPAAFYCGVCGMAVRVQHAEPRVVNELRGTALSVLGQSVQTDFLDKHIRKSFSTLLNLGVFLVLAAIVIELIRPLVKGKPFAPIVGMLSMLLPGSGFVGVAGLPIGAICGALGVFFVAIAMWSRREPLHAALTGSLIYIAFACLEGTLQPMAICQAAIVKIIIVLALISAVKAGFAHRRVMNALPSTSTIEATGRSDDAP